MSRAGARRAILSLAALVFAGIAVGSLVSPHTMAGNLGYRLESVDALSEFRAVYVGLWLAQALLLGFAAKRIEQPVLGDLGALLILGQVFGRLVSIALDGVPGPRIWPISVLELAGGVALLIVRPARRS